MQSQTKINPSQFPVALIPDTKDSGYISVIINYGWPGCVRIEHSRQQPHVFTAQLTRKQYRGYPFYAVFSRYLDDNLLKTKHVILRQFRRFLVYKKGIYYVVPIFSAIEIVDRIVTYQIKNKDH